MDFESQNYKKLVFCKELSYVIGALLGDGCIYRWGNEHQVWLIGDKKFAEKYAKNLSKVINRKVSFYERRKRNYWYVKISNIDLYNLFNDLRKDYDSLYGFLQEGDIRENSLRFIEGFFDAEGCVKIVKEYVRKTPKICLDFANTDLKLLELTKNLVLEFLQINSNISKQVDKRRNRKIMYHLRIYKKESIRVFLDNVSTIKLKTEKVNYVRNWLNNGK